MFGCLYSDEIDFSNNEISNLTQPASATTDSKSIDGLPAFVDGTSIYNTRNEIANSRDKKCELKAQLKLDELESMHISQVDQEVQQIWAENYDSDFEDVLKI